MTSATCLCFALGVFLLLAGARCDVDICEKGNPADVVFLLDASNSIWNPDFREQLRFVQEVIDYFPIGDENIRVAVATYADDVYPQFPLNQHEHKTGLKLAVEDIMQDMGSYTRTDTALQFMRNEFFSTDNGARDDVFKVGIVITDGQSYDPAITEEEARLAKESGIHMFAIGVGSRVDMDELRNIASFPTNHYRFLVDSYRGLQSIIKFLAIKACTVTAPPTTTTTTTPVPTTPRPTHPPLRFETPPPSPVNLLPEGLTTPGVQPLRGRDTETVNSGDNEFDNTFKGGIFTMDGCLPSVPLDITFVLDSKKGGTRSKRKLWKFVRNVVDSLNLDNGDITVNFIYDCLVIPGFQLREHKTRKALLKALRSPRRSGARSTGDLLRDMTQTLNSAGANSELTDGQVANAINNRLSGGNGGQPGDIESNKLFNGHSGDIADATNTNGQADDIFNRLTNDRSTNEISDRRKVGVYVTDGASDSLRDTLAAAQDAKHGAGADVELFAVGVGKDADPVELTAMVSCPPERHLHLVDSYKKLKGGLGRMLARDLCQGVTGEIKEERPLGLSGR